jgi:hypothetical protein
MSNKISFKTACCFEFSETTLVLLQPVNQAIPLDFKIASNPAALSNCSCLIRDLSPAVYFNRCMLISYRSRQNMLLADVCVGRIAAQSLWKPAAPSRGHRLDDAIRDSAAHPQSRLSPVLDPWLAEAAFRPASTVPLLAEGAECDRGGGPLSLRGRRSHCSSRLGPTGTRAGRALRRLAPSAPPGDGAPRRVPAPQPPLRARPRRQGRWPRRRRMLRGGPRAPSPPGQAAPRPLG